MEHSGCFSTKIIACAAGTVMALTLFIPILWLWGNILAITSVKACGLDPHLDEIHCHQSVTYCHDLEDEYTTCDVMDDSWIELEVKKAKRLK